ncbi:conserved hypothetical protein [Neospora caninum Liverpool]|uniref:Uncharacterized protein n=1 Tax=Neospora caninum (strain Liverpool) TaxID=572307 RepID=F0VC01_NEOCL|nr:conserved hypothetical protein [Neospora caninum Liverpool]CBZ51135.1 conserved hypothetical protein [Neospora caninum Liverpool]CEL68443.1 TPA: hypothetical protein BN1204_042100 [Neospora caninum Liverpool]|eukprot:XP_003881168.1 conserved hypothetical protein [Neospora caninum Liverpool]
MNAGSRLIFVIVALTAGLAAAAGVNGMKTKNGDVATQLIKKPFPGLTLEVQPEDDDDDDALFPDELGTSYEGALRSMTSLSPEEMTAAEVSSLHFYASFAVQTHS